MDRLTAMDAFVRVVEAGSFSAAARQWGCSKAAVSKYVSGLESHLGVLLLQRTTRSLRLTDIGRLYYDRCVGVLGEIEQLEASLHAVERLPEGVLRVTAPPGFASRYQDWLSTAFVDRYPGITVELYLTHRMVNLVEEGFDVAIRVTKPRDSTLIARRLASAPMVAVASPEYLESHGVPMAPGELQEHSCLVDTNFRAQGRWHFVVGGRDEWVDVSGPFRVNSPIVVCQLATDGHGIALCPHFVAEEALSDGRLVEVLPGMPGYDWSIYAMYPQRRYVPERVKVFVDWLAECFEAEGLVGSG